MCPPAINSASLAIDFLLHNCLRFTDKTFFPTDNLNFNIWTALLALTMKSQIRYMLWITLVAMFCRIFKQKRSNFLHNSNSHNQLFDYAVSRHRICLQKAEAVNRMWWDAFVKVLWKSSSKCDCVLSNLLLILQQCNLKAIFNLHLIYRGRNRKEVFMSIWTTKLLTATVSYYLNTRCYEDILWHESSNPLLVLNLRTKRWFCLLIAVP